MSDDKTKKSGDGSKDDDATKKLDNSAESARKRASKKDSSASDDAPTEKVKAAASTAAKKTEAAASTAAKKTEEAAGAAADKVKEAGQDASAAAKETGEALKAGAAEAGEAISNTAKEAAERAKKFAQDNESSTKPGKPAPEGETRVAHISYALLLFGATNFVTGIAALIASYMRKGRPEVEGTLLESHFRWIIMTFWYSVLGAVVSFLLMAVLIGFPLLIAVALLFIYRVVKGWLALNDGEEITNPNALW